MAGSTSPSIAIVTDSSASLTATQCAIDLVEVVPLKVIIGADEFAELQTDAAQGVTTEKIADALNAFVPVSTSRPTPDEFAQTYRRLKKAGAKSVVSIHLSSKMSGTIDSAKVAARAAKLPVTVVDTEQVGMSVGFAVEAAIRARSRADIDAVVSAAQQAAWSSTTLLYVDTLDHLKAGGRIGAAAALVGSALAVKPILALSDGLVVPLERVRTSGRALARLEAMAIEAVEAGGRPCDVAVQHLANEAIARRTADRLSSAVDLASIRVAEVGAAIGAHVGPGMIAIAVTPRID